MFFPVFWKYHKVLRSPTAHFNLVANFRLIVDEILRNIQNDQQDLYESLCMSSLREKDAMSFFKNTKLWCRTTSYIIVL